MSENNVYYKMSIIILFSLVYIQTTNDGSSIETSDSISFTYNCLKNNAVVLRLNVKSMYSA